MVALLVAVGATAAPTEAPVEEPSIEEHISSRNYEQINRYLVDKVVGQDVESNLAAAVEFMTSDPKRGSLLNGSLKAALKQFTALKAIRGGPDKCSVSSYDILIRNDRTTAGKTHSKRVALDKLNRVERIIFDVSKQHAIDCQQVYTVEFKKRYAELDRELVRPVEEYIRSVHDVCLEPKDRQNEASRRAASRELARQRSVKPTVGFASAKVLYKVIETLAGRDKDSGFTEIVQVAESDKKEVNKDRLRQLFNRYLIEPCQYYVEKLGPGLFIPAEYDGEMVDYESFYTQDTAEVTDFLLGLDGYHLCHFLVDENDWVQDDVFRNLVKVAKRSS